jgi:hypothetical protein
VRLEVVHGAAEDALEGGHHQRADNGRRGGGAEQPLEVGEQVRGGVGDEVGLDPLAEKGTQEGVGRARDQHQHVEQSEGDRDAAGAHAGDADGVGQRADQVDRERQRAQDDQLQVHQPLPARVVAAPAAERR